MSDAILTSLINGAFGLVLLWYGRRLSNRVKRVQHQVENGHNTNLREEADDRHAENSGHLTLIATRLETAIEEIQGLRRSVRRLWERSDKHTDQLNDIERTQDRIEIPLLPGGRGAHRREAP